MKKLFLSGFIVFMLIAVNAQYYTTMTSKAVNIKKECQACFRNFDFSAVNLKWTSDCPSDESHKSKVGCLVDLVLYLSYNSLVVKKIDTWQAIHDSKCPESQSGKHLWKELSKDFVVITKDQKYPLSTDWCSSVELIKNKNSIAYLNYKASFNLVSKWQKE
jgi:hypothetical protein